VNTRETRDAFVATGKFADCCFSSPARCQRQSGHEAKAFAVISNEHSTAVTNENLIMSSRPEPLHLIKEMYPPSFFQLSNRNLPNAKQLAAMNGESSGEMEVIVSPLWGRADTQ